MIFSDFPTVVYRYCNYPLLFILLPVVLRAADEGASATRKLTLPQAIQLAIAADSQLRVYSSREEVAQAEAEQAGLRPNPVVGVEIENVLGTGTLGGLDAAEITVGLRQAIETADKLEKRVLLARARGDAVEAARLERLVAVEAAVRREFVSILLARESLQLQRSFLDLLRENERATAKLVESARAPQVDLARARLAVERKQFAVDQAAREVESARARLAVLLGFESPKAFEVEGKVALESELPEISELLSRLDSVPAVIRFESVSRVRAAELELERAKARPDFEIFAGARYHNEPGDGALVAGIEIPWPVFDRNAGNIRAAEVRLKATEQEKAAIMRELRLRVTALYQELLAAHAEATAALENLLPAAEDTLAETMKGFERGVYSQLRVIDARETLFEIRKTYLDALGRFARAQAEIESITMPAPQPVTPSSSPSP